MDKTEVANGVFGTTALTGAGVTAYTVWESARSKVIRDKKLVLEVADNVYWKGIAEQALGEAQLDRVIDNVRLINVRLVDGVPKWHWRKQNLNLIYGSSDIPCGDLRGACARPENRSTGSAQEQLQMVAMSIVDGGVPFDDDVISTKFRSDTMSRKWTNLWESRKAMNRL